MPTGPPWSRPTGSTRCSRHRASARTTSGSSGSSSPRASSPTTSTACAPAWKEHEEPMNQPPDLAHIAHAELLTPFPDESLRFFTELFGMQIEHRESQSVFLRGWGEYQPYGLKLTESRLPGLGHVAIRAWSPDALQRRVAAIDTAGLGDEWIGGDHGHGPAYR